MRRPLGRTWTIGLAATVGAACWVWASAPTLAATGGAAIGPGSTGPGVVILQDTLQDWGRSTPTDGIFTAATSAAVEAVAASQGITVHDLAVDYMVIGYGPSAMAIDTGAQGAAVSALQRALTRAGFGVEATGRFGPFTAQQADAFERANGLAVGGALTLWEVERAALSHPPAPTSSPPAAPPAAQSVRLAVTSLATRLVGHPYIWGGAGPWAFDCSGLTSYVLRVAGHVTLPHSSYLQWQRGSAAALASLQPGDLVFFDTNGSGASHVGIYLGGVDRDFVSAANPRYGVHIDTLYDAYWADHYLGARDVLP